MVGPEAELAAYRIEVGLAQRFTEGVLVARVGFFQGAENQQGGIVTLCGIEGRRTTVRLAETVDKGVVSFVVEIIGPQRGVHGTDGRATHRLNDDLVKGEG